MGERIGLRAGPHYSHERSHKVQLRGPHFHNKDALRRAPRRQKMAKTASGRYAFIIENIKRLPVVASQDQEFWLAAAISCRDAIVYPVITSESSVAPRLSPDGLLQIYRRCLKGYNHLGSIGPPGTAVPVLRQ